MISFIKDKKVFAYVDITVFKITASPESIIA